MSVEYELDVDTALLHPSQHSIGRIRFEALRLRLEVQDRIDDDTRTRGLVINEIRQGSGLRLVKSFNTQGGRSPGPTRLGSTEMHSRNDAKTDCGDPPQQPRLDPHRVFHRHVACNACFTDSRIA